MTRAAASAALSLLSEPRPDMRGAGAKLLAALAALMGRAAAVELVDGLPAGAAQARAREALGVR